jgi:hypothetical protein
MQEESLKILFHKTEEQPNSTEYKTEKRQLSLQIPEQNRTEETEWNDHD